jgi:hypothetical protein
VNTGRIPGFVGGASFSTGGDAGVNGRVVSDCGAGASATAIEAVALKGEAAICEEVGPNEAGPGDGRGVPEDLH